eukprot:6212717-Pleurochrysis_carterae.AAC.1
MRHGRILGHDEDTNVASAEGRHGTRPNLPGEGHVPAQKWATRDLVAGNDQEERKRAEEHDSAGSACARESLATAYRRRPGRRSGNAFCHYLVLTGVSYQLPPVLTSGRHVFCYVVNCRFSARSNLHQDLDPAARRPTCAQTKLTELFCKTPFALAVDKGCPRERSLAPPNGLSLTFRSHIPATHSRLPIGDDRCACSDAQKSPGSANGCAFRAACEMIENVSRSFSLTCRLLSVDRFGHL